MSVDQTQWYPSKIDWWLVPLLCIPPASAVIACAVSSIQGSITDFVIAVAIAIFVAGLYFGLVFPMRYGFSETHLIIRNGMCTQRILLSEISEVHPTRNPLSSPSLSLDRLHVQFGEGFFKAVLISPADRVRFMDELAQKASLERVGNRLYRA
jgi:hypothetical protein